MGRLDDIFVSLYISSLIGHMPMYTLFCANIASNNGDGVFYVKPLAALMSLFILQPTNPMVDLDITQGRTYASDKQNKFMRELVNIVTVLLSLSKTMNPLLCS